jgi:hypothetical protein
MGTPMRDAKPSKYVWSLRSLYCNALKPSTAVEAQRKVSESREAIYSSITGTVHTVVQGEDYCIQ